MHLLKYNSLKQFFRASTILNMIEGMTSLPRVKSTEFTNKPNFFQRNFLFRKIIYTSTTTSDRRRILLHVQPQVKRRRYIQMKHSTQYLILMRLAASSPSSHTVECSVKTDQTTITIHQSMEVLYQSFCTAPSFLLVLSSSSMPSEKRLCFVRKVTAQHDQHRHHRVLFQYGKIICFSSSQIFHLEKR